MKTTVKKWGKSLALRISKPVVAEFEIKTKPRVSLSSKGNKLEITPATKPVLSLRKLLKQVTKKNKHREYYEN